MSLEKFQFLELETQELKTEIQNLNAENQGLKIKNQSLIRDINILRLENQELRTQNNRLQHMLVNANTRIMNLEKKLDEVIAINNALFRENKKLKLSTLHN